MMTRVQLPATTAHFFIYKVIMTSFLSQLAQQCQGPHKSMYRYILVLGVLLILTMKARLHFVPGIHVNVESTRHAGFTDVSDKEAVKQPRNAAHNHPLMRLKLGEISINQVPPLPVAVYPYVSGETKRIRASAVHIEENGILESSRLYHAQSFFDFSSPNIIWYGDQGFPFNKQPRKWCRTFGEIVLEAQQRRQSQGLPTQWPIYIASFADDPELNRCRNIEQVVGQEYVFYSIRSIVQGRFYNRRKDWINIGHPLELSDGATSFTHMPLIVRTDTVETLRDVLRETYQLELQSPIETLERKVDVSHFWPTDTSEEALWVGKSQFRHKVSVTIESMKDDYADFNFYVGLAGEGHHAGRNGVQSIYIQSLLETKIVVLTQRDEYEDHYRLFEALVTGGMVLTDRMLSLPAGLQNGTSIVEFTSAQDLQNKILHYLQHDDERIDIAKQGRHVAMSRHRSWHRMEELFLGQPVTTCIGSSACPFIVHAEDGVN